MLGIIITLIIIGLFIYAIGSLIDGVKEAKPLKVGISICGIMALIILLLLGYFSGKKEEQKKQENQSRTNLTIESFDLFSEETLKMAYYYVDEDLKLTAVSSETGKETVDGQVVVSTNKTNNIVEIPNDIPGKLIFHDGNEVKIQFGKSENCYLIFEIAENDNKYKLKVENKEVINYDGKEYVVDGSPCVLYKLKENYSENTVLRKETGAW